MPSRPPIQAPVYAAEPNCLTNPESAPQFLKFDPSNKIEEGQNIKAIFSPPQTTPDPSYTVRYKVAVGSKIYTDFNKEPTQWTIDLGTFKKNLYNMVWYLSLVKNGKENLSKCGSYEFLVCKNGDCPNAAGFCTVFQGEKPSTLPQSGTGAQGKCPTALGSIPTNPKAFAERILQIGIGLGGRIAFILMVIGSIRVLTSSGDQQKLSGGRDMIVAAIAGLLFIIFSVLILQFIGVEIIDLEAGP